jgi:hypothetical protein
MSNLTKIHALDAALRRDFGCFIQKSFGTVVPGESFHPNWHIDSIAWHLTEVAAGRSKRLLITLPPRSLKSFCASVAFPAWVLGNEPAKKVVCLSYSADLAKGFANGTRAIMSTAWYQRAFSRARIDSAKNTELEIMTTARGFRYTASVQGTLTGRGGNFVIIDDPMKGIDAFSAVERTKLKDWFTNTLLSRLDNKATDAIVVVTQRLHADDLAGHLLEKGGWRHLCIPAIAEEDQTFPIGTAHAYRRLRGEPVDCVRESLEVLQQLRAEMEPAVFETQYQQNPRPSNGNIIDPQWLNYYAANDRPEKFDTILQSWDTANKVTDFANFSVCTTWGFTGPHAYLLDVLRQKLNFPDLRARILECARLHGANTVIIEEKASG